MIFSMFLIKNVNKNKWSSNRQKFKNAHLQSQKPGSYNRKVYFFTNGEPMKLPHSKICPCFASILDPFLQVFGGLNWDFYREFKRSWSCDFQCFTWRWRKEEDQYWSQNYSQQWNHGRGFHFGRCSQWIYWRP